MACQSKVLYNDLISFLVSHNVLQMNGTTVEPRYKEVGYNKTLL